MAASDDLTQGKHPARLDEYDAAEWFDVCRVLRPDLTREEFDRMWAEFQAEKLKRKLQ